VRAKDVHVASVNGDMAKVQELLSDSRAAYLVDINHQEPISGNTLLHDAIEQNNFDYVAWTLKMGADPLMRDKRGRLPAEKTKSERVKNILKGGRCLLSAVAGDCAVNRSIELARVSSLGPGRNYIFFVGRRLIDQNARSLVQVDQLRIGLQETMVCSGRW
jgi:hypothetical protein